jgi:short-subunit dehydrogenase
VQITKDTVAVITGASEGIGEAVARALAAQGAKVVLAARSPDKLQKLSQELPGSFAIETDMRKAEDVKNLIDKTVEKFGRIDILVNNAGQGLGSPIESLNLDDFRAVIELNDVAVVRAMQLVIPHMRTQKSGVILNVSSMTSKMLIPNLAGYASTKYMLNTLSLTARKELEGTGIAVCVFYPRMTATNFGANAQGQKYDSRAGVATMGGDTAEEVAEKIIKQIESEEAEAMMGQ